MKYLQNFIVLATLALTTSCISLGKFRTVEKPCKKTDLVFKDCLLGEWRDGYTNTRYIFSKDKIDGDKCYKLERIKNDERHLLQVFLFKIKENYFLDISLHEDDPNTPSDNSVVELVHYILKIDFNDKTPIIIAFDKNMDWLSDNDKKNDNPFSVVWSLVNIPLKATIATTDCIRTFLALHADDGKVFPNKNRIRLRRIVEEDKCTSQNNIDDELDNFLN